MILAWPLPPGSQLIHVMGASGGALRDAGPPVWTRLHVLAAAALALRIVVALWSERISHPDELFQYLEQAHRLVYGYGFIPWEYRFGTRNWLLPGALAAMLEAMRLAGLDWPTAYVPAMKTIFAILSVCVVYASYEIGRNLFCERTGRIAAVFAAIWYELLYYSTAPTPEVLGAYTIVCALALMMGPGTGRRAVFVGLLLGAGAALRMQYAVPAAALWVLALIGWKWRHALSAAISGAAMLALAGVLDAWTWGAPFASFYNSVLFNVGYGVSELFGQSHVIWYLYRLTFVSFGLHTIAMGYGMLAWKRCWPILLLAACVVVPHSLVPHKEYRFVFLAVPLLLVLLADAIAYGLPQLRPFSGRPSAWRIAIAAVAAVSALGCAFRGVFAQDDRLIATLDLSRRSELAAVLDLTGPWWHSGAFYFLHRDVPYYFKEQIAPAPAGDIHTLVSHILVPAARAEIPGFRVSKRYETVAILEQESPPPAYRRLEKDGREPRMPAIEDRFVPEVRPRF
jgi:GPI mannosyltransferase 3